MSDIELLKQLPSEHWTPWEGKWIMVKELLKILLDKQKIEERKCKQKKKRK